MRRRFQTRHEEMNEEANYFAMHLLVPDSLLAKEKLDSLDIADDAELKALAKKYDVSVMLMMLRIRQFLGLK